jgi:protein TonB
MRRDLIIGILFSLCVHGGVAWLGEAFKPGAQKAAPKEETPTIQLMEMPKLDDPPEEKVEADDQPVTPLDFAPPMQTDVPQIITESSFVQQIQPPPPEGLKPATGVISIPAGRPGGLGKGIEVFDISKLDQIPQAKFRAKPVYPFDMRRAGISGEVVVEFICDTNGDVLNPFAVRSTQREFEAAAVQAVSKWKFRPGKKGGRAVNTRMQQPISFTLNEE